MALSITTSAGSTVILPLLPPPARALTATPWPGAVATESCPALESSTRPPLPLRGPPRAVMEPQKLVPDRDHTSTVPPLPVWVASAARVEFVSTVVLAEEARGPAPCQPPPISMVPPPRAPLASRAAPSRVVEPLPEMSITPPVPALPVAESAPESRTKPVADILIEPPVAPSVLSLLVGDSITVLPPSRKIVPPVPPGLSADSEPARLI